MTDEDPKVLRGNIDDALRAVERGEARSLAQALRQEEARRELDGDIAEIERVWAAATPGPWTWQGESDDSGGEIRLTQVDASATDCTAYGELKPAAILVGCDEWVTVSSADREAIAAAPSHVAMLVAEVKRLRAESAFTAPLVREAVKRAAQAARRDGYDEVLREVEAVCERVGREMVESTTAGDVLRLLMMRIAQWRIRFGYGAEREAEKP